MKHFSLLLLTYFGLAADSWFSGRWPIANEPRFVPLLLVCAVLMWHDWRAILWSAAIGLAADAITADRIGVQMLAAVLMAFVCQQLLGVIRGWDIVRFTGLSFLLTFGLVAADQLFRLVQAPSVLTFIEVLGIASRTAAATALLGGTIRTLLWALTRLTPGFRVERDAFRNDWSMLTD